MDPIVPARRPRAVAVAEVLIAFAVGVSVARWLSSGFAALILLRWTLPSALALLAVRQRRRWAPVLLGVVIGCHFVLLRASPWVFASLGLHLAALAYVLAPSSRAWLASAPDPRRAGRGTRVVLGIVLSLQIALVLLSSYWLAMDSSGWSAVLWALFLVPYFWALGAVALFLRGGGNVRTVRAVALVLAIAGPLVAWELKPVGSLLVQAERAKTRERQDEEFAKQREDQRRRAEAKREEDARARLAALPGQTRQAIASAAAAYPEQVRRGQLETWFELCKEPQRVEAAGDWYVVLDGHRGVRLYGMDRSLRTRQAFEAWGRERLAGAVVDLRVPDGAADRYTVGWKVPWIRKNGGVLDDFGHQFGEVDGLVFLDGHLINLDYCLPEQRDRLQQYQDAYLHGDL